ncbi:hypothetical protein CsSME_00025444 [Camellia sinensis var. sinensis]
MEFKFRAIDEQASTYLPPPSSSSSSISYFTEQALRAGYSGPDFGRPAEFFRNPNDVREAIQRELEKQRIREEIVAGEIARKRLLEAEVRREMLMEREMALRGAERFSLFSGSAAVSAMQFEPRLSLLHQSDGRSLEERLALSLEDRLGYQARRGNGGFGTFSFQHNAEPKISEVKTPSEVSKEKIIFLGKPEESFSGAKRKAVTPPVSGGSELPSISGSNKKLKEEWSCALCHVSATSEQGLNEHLQGRKHKAREAGLRALRTGKNYAIGLFPKKSAKPTIQIIETIDNKISELLPVNKTGEKLLQKKSKAEDVKQSNNLALQVISKETNASSNHKSGKFSGQKMQKSGDHKKKYKFWCEMCKIGAHSEKVMNDHRKGKKHVGRLQELNKNAASQTEKALEKEKEDPEVVVIDGKEEMRDNVDRAADGDDVAVENPGAVAEGMQLVVASID